MVRLKDPDKAWRREDTDGSQPWWKPCPSPSFLRGPGPGAPPAQRSLPTAFELQQHSSLLDSGPDWLGCHCSSPKQHYQATRPKLSLSAWQIFFLNLVIFVSW